MSHPLIFLLDKEIAESSVPFPLSSDNGRVLRFDKITKQGHNAGGGKRWSKRKNLCTFLSLLGVASN